MKKKSEEITSDSSDGADFDMRLRDYALSYLARFPATLTKLRIVLLRRARLKNQTLSPRGLATLLAELQASGYVDDQRFAQARASALLRRGASLYEIRGKLARDGVTTTQIQTTLARFIENGGREELELSAALRVARKRRLGPFRKTTGDGSIGDGSAGDYALRQKDMAALARKGFSSGIVQRLFAASEDDLETWQKKIEEEY